METNATPPTPENRNDKVITVSSSQVKPVEQPKTTVQAPPLIATPAVPTETSNEPTASAMETAGPTIINVYKWSVEDVYDYMVKHASPETAKVLKEACIDGRALLLLTVPVLKDELKLKLGPVLVLKAKIEELREKCCPDEHEYLPDERNIYKWNERDVYHFVNMLVSKDIAEEFESQEMDGQALTLLSKENIIHDMQMSFGAGLKILSKIQELKDSAESCG